ncbi:hypothetical protein EDD15DRAFT_2169406, partial [Pisolithus albus]
YGFQTSADKSIQEKNRLLVSEIKQDASFVFCTRGATLDDHKGIYANPAIQQVINEVLFKNKADGGLIWSTGYNPFPKAGFALVLTAMECAIDEWTSETREQISFKEDNYASVFENHLASLNDFDRATTKHKLLPKLMKEVYKIGWYVHNNVDTCN